MPTKTELMDWMKKYKKENCKSISTMKKDELFEEAKRHGYLQEKFGIKKKSESKKPKSKKASVNIRDAFPAEKKKTKTAPSPAPVPKTSGMTKKEIFAKIKELNKFDFLNITKDKEKELAAKRKKLFEMLKTAA
jgi:hypothetical protein